MTESQTSHQELIKQPSDTPAGSYTMDTVAVILQTYGIPLAPKFGSDVTGKIDIACYPYANVFPINALIEDTLRYILARRNDARNRRIGLIMRDEQDAWMMLLINLRDIQRDTLYSVCESLHGIDLEKDETIKELLQDKELIEKIRTIYGQVEPLIIGVEADEALAEKIGQLLKQAYGLKMQLKSIPAESNTHRDVHIVHDAITLLRTGKLQREVPTADLFAAQRNTCSHALKMTEANLKLYEKANNALADYAAHHVFDEAE